MTDDERRQVKAERWRRWIEKNGDRHKANQRRWNEENREHRREYQKAYHARNRRRQRLARYGLTEVEYDAAVAAQGGACAVCRRVPDYELIPDHDHSCCPGDRACGRCIRGLLCQGCNAGIGYLGDTVEAVERALDYLTDARRQAAKRLFNNDGRGRDAYDLAQLAPGARGRPAA